MHKYCKMHWPLVLGVVGALGFVAEYLWQIALVNEELSAFHMMLLQTYVIGFSGMNVGSFVLGLVEWFVWGFIIGAVVMALSNHCRCMKGHEGGCCGSGGTCSMCGKDPCQCK